jgi:hypothetical protein
MSSLYQISADLIALRNALEVEEEFDLDSDERKKIENSIAIKQEELVQKSEGYIHIISQVEAQADMAQKEIDRINIFKKRKEHIAERLKAALLQALLEFGEDDKGIKRLEVGTHRLSTRRNPFVKINDSERVPDECKLCDVTFKNVSVDIKNFIARMVQKLPDSETKSELIAKFEPGIKISKTLIKKFIEEHPVTEEVAPEVLDENAIQEAETPWAEIDVNYSMTIK